MIASSTMKDTSKGIVVSRPGVPDLVLDDTDKEFVRRALAQIADMDPGEYRHAKAYIHTQRPPRTSCVSDRSILNSPNGVKAYQITEFAGISYSHLFAGEGARE